MAIRSAQKVSPEILIATKKWLHKAVRYTIYPRENKKIGG